MGNKSGSQFNWEDQYAIMEKNFNNGTLILQRNIDGKVHSFIGRQIVSNDSRTFDSIRSLAQIKLHNHNPYLTTLSNLYSSSTGAYCANQYKIYLLFEYPGSTLKEEIVSRRFMNEFFSEQEVDVLIQSTIKGIRKLKEQGHPHNNISSSSIFIDDERQIILGDPWATPPTYQFKQNQNGFSYPSPEKILYQNDQIFQLDVYLSDLFSVGTVALETLNLQHMDFIYEKGFRRVLQPKIQEKVNQIKSPDLKNKIQILLSHQPSKRQDIYECYQSTSTFCHKKRMAQQILDRASGKANSQINLRQQSPSQVVRQIEEPRVHTATNKNFNPNANTHVNIPVNTHVNTHIINTNINTFGSHSRQLASGNIQPRPVYYENMGVKRQSVRINFVNKAQINCPQQIYTVSRVNYEQRPMEVFQKEVKVIGKEEESSESLKEGLKTSNSEHRTMKHEELGKEKKQDFKFEEENKKETKIDNPKTLEHISIYTIGANKLKDKTPTQSLEIESQQFVNEQRKTMSENSDRGFLQSINDAQQFYHYQDLPIQTPEKRPKKKYNSTIKQVSENSSKDEENDDGFLYVIEEYQVGRYEGFKKNGMRNGRGKFNYSEGSMYEGEWKNNQMHGFGTLYYSNGKVAYEGEWFQDEFHGVGKVYNQQENKFNGEYDYKNLSDFEEYWSVYEGDLNCDRRHGKGKIRLSNGQVFIGTFVNDEVEGDGQFHTLRGEVIYGKWKKNKLIKVK